MTGEDVCNEAGFAIARRTLDCTGDADLALDRYLQLEEQWTCRELDPEVDALDGWLNCAVDLEALSCDEVALAGDDLASWLSSSAACVALFTEDAP